MRVKDGRFDSFWTTIWAWLRPDRAHRFFLRLEFLDERSLSLSESARGALGDGGEAGRVSRRHCPGHASDSQFPILTEGASRSQGSPSLSADVPLGEIIEYMFFFVK